MQQKQFKKSKKKGQVKIEFSEKLISSWGGTATIISRYLDKIGFRELIEKTFPIQDKSNNSTGVYSKIISLFISVLNGGTKFSHINYMENGLKIFERCFRVDRLVKSSSSITRFFNKYNHRISNEILLQNINKYILDPILKQAGISEDTLRFDSTVMTRFGKQEGAKKGYNPAKRGRLSHNPQIAFLGNGYTVNFWNRSGNAVSANGIVEFYEQTRSFISDIKITRVLADSGFYSKNFIKQLEKDNIDYVIATPIHQYFQRIIYNLENWTTVAEGIEVSEFEYSHHNADWEGGRRYIAVRQELKKRQEATGKQLRLFINESYYTEYRHSLYVTNDEEATPHEIWNYYKPRANDENVIKNLKEGFGLSAYNMKSFWATEAVLMTICLIFHNLITLLVKNIIDPGGKRKTLRSLRMEYLIVPAIMGKDGRNDVIRIGLSNPKRKNKFIQILERIADMKVIFYCNAVEIGELI